MKPTISLCALLVLLLAKSTIALSITKQTASTFLKTEKSRSKRANRLMSEMKPSNFESECAEETCDIEEFLEIVENENNKIRPEVDPDLFESSYRECSLSEAAAVSREYKDENCSIQLMVTRQSKSTGLRVKTLRSTRQEDKVLPKKKSGFGNEAEGSYISFIPSNDRLKSGENRRLAIAVYREVRTRPNKIQMKMEDVVENKGEFDGDDDKKE